MKTPFNADVEEKVIGGGKGLGRAGGKPKCGKLAQYWESGFENGRMGRGTGVCMTLGGGDGWEAVALTVLSWKNAH